MLESTAQLLVVEDPDNMSNSETQRLIPIEVVELPADEHAFEVSEPEHESIEVMEDGQPATITIIVDDLLGAPKGTKDPEPILEVEEEEEKKPDENDAKSSKTSVWDWSVHGPSGFIAWVKLRLDSVPSHSGMDSSGIKRACAYLEKLDNEISRAMQEDLDGELDANQIEHVRTQIEHGIKLLKDRLDKINQSKKTQKRRKSSDDQSVELVKEGQKITGVQGTYVTVPLLISGIARVCINGVVSAGHNLDYIYNEQVKKYKLNDREKSEVRWLLFDMGYPLRGDFGYLPDEEYDTSSSDNFSWSANYKA